jgi:hypothetical protein
MGRPVSGPATTNPCRWNGLQIPAPVVDAYHTDQEPVYPAISRPYLCELNRNPSSSNGIIAIKGATQEEERNMKRPEEPTEGAHQPRAVCGGANNNKRDIAPEAPSFI